VIGAADGDESEGFVKVATRDGGDAPSPHEGQEWVASFETTPMSRPHLSVW
jgi:hypothetical protein